MPGPLDGIRVIDITTVVLGPYATQLLGDMGADVIKIESPAGDISRNMGAGRNPGMAGSFLNVNRNKRSLALDLKQDSAKQALRRLIQTADVLVHNMRPKAIARLGFDYDAVSALKPDIIYVGTYGFGQDGPYRDRPAYDDAIQGASGLASLFQKQGGAPRYAPSTIADKVVGLTVSQAVAAALFHRERSGVGQFIEVPMMETVVSFNLVEHLCGGAYDPPIGGIGYQRAISASRRPFPTSDGYVCILPYTDVQCRNFFATAGREHVMDDPRFRTYTDRVENIDAFYDLVAEVTPQKSTAVWLELCEAGQIPCMPVIDVDDLMDDEHLKAVGLFEKHHHPTEGETVLVRPPVKFSKTPSVIYAQAPSLGQHGPELLRELGYDERSIDEMRSTGALRGPAGEVS